MERIVYQSKYAIAKYDDEKGLYHLTYLPDTANMTNQEWKDLMIELYDVTDKLKPKYILDDNRKRYFHYSPELQEWTLNLFIEMWNRNGLKKYVQVIPDDLVGQLSAEQIVELANIKFSDIFENTFVTTYEEAIVWLKI